MIDVHCPDCGRVLIGTRQILAVANAGGGIEMTYVCWCGRLGAERVGRAPLRRRPAAEAEPAGRA
jgi:hypothetical protein